MRPVVNFGFKDKIVHGRNRRTYINTQNIHKYVFIKLAIVR